MKSINWTKTLIGFGIIAAWAFTIDSERQGQDAAADSVLTETPAEREVRDNGREAERLDQAISRAVSSLPDPEKSDLQPGQTQNRPSLAQQFAEALVDYARLRSKLFLSDENKSQKARLLQDAELMRALELLLKSSANDMKSQELQNDAIDLLLEARASGSRDAESVLRSVLEDRQIENDAMELGQRKALAGIKAEILYQWSALEPARAEEMRRWLPGPISEKIWSNVVDAQDQNELESQGDSI